MKKKYSIDYEKWAKLSFVGQMGNISSEVGRAISAQKRDDEASRNAAISRALDLFSASAKALARQKSPRLREVLRARDQFLPLFFASNFRDANHIENYFMQFAIAARSGR